MVLIYSTNTSPRLQYIVSFIFKELMGTDVAITIDTTEFEQYDGFKINYSNIKIEHCKFSIAHSNLLFETGIKEQPIKCYTTNKYKAFFKTSNSDFSFDIFAASFYLISRYEEYLPYTKDMYGRYAHENSIAYKEGFLNLPLINSWVNDFADEFQKVYPSFNIHHPSFTFIPTYDIDIAYSYKHKGFARNLGGALKSLATFKFSDVGERIAVLINKKCDPYDTFASLDKLHQEYNLKPIYFFLIAAKNALYDKNILPHKKVMQKLIEQHAAKYSIGIHPSWQSGDSFSILKKEKKQLEAISGTAITNSRQHYIRFNLPQGYRHLMDIGITDDYSMGYGSINGFRASVASSFYWYDLSKEEQTILRIHPFCFMEANSFYEQRVSSKKAYDEMMHYYNACKAVDGTFISIWHNDMIGFAKPYEGWGKMYSNFLRTVT